MSALGTEERIANISIPFLVIHALDDPLISWRTLGNPDEIINSGNGHVMMLLTRAGGHVGWPLGMNPKLDKWKWMNDRTYEFVSALDRVKKNLT